MEAMMQSQHLLFSLLTLKGESDGGGTRGVTKEEEVVESRALS